MKKLLGPVVGIFIIFAMAGGMSLPSFAASELPRAVAIGTSSIGGVYYVLSVGMADIINKHTPMSATAEAVGGSDANMRAIKAGKVHLAMANTFSSVNAYRGVQQFAKDGRLPVRLLALGQPSYRQTVVRVAAGIKTIADLKGKKLVAKRRALAELELVADAQLKAYGLDRKDVQYIATAKTDEAISALISGTVDAAVIPGGAPAAFLIKLFEKIDARILNIPPDKMKIVLEELGPAFYDDVIRGGIYRGQSEAVHAPAMGTSLVAAENLPEAAAYEVIKALYKNFDSFKMVHKAAAYWTLDNTLGKFPIPFHPGAIRYFKEIGSWTAAHERKQEKLSAK
ncbi:MAG: TAXI family TRAP transporter solute-binding subunit [Desulfobacterales bacterium]|nr:TAXI family TRAP transporter solute-binding subunit [Desulfobacterales bacterium]